jgi:hypothetical protein
MEQENFPMEIFLFTELDVPLIQLLVLVLFSSIALLFGKFRIALLTNYIFTMYWAYMFNKNYLMKLGSGKFEVVSTIYFIFGFGILFLALAGFVHQKHEKQ